ncbi:MAG TPA: NAD(P)-binding protein [Kiritimatiellia bacterium]|nr:NAD(P)-binding protein [Kiritimatiellia bacterium]
MINKKFLIIGAGPTGLGAAWRLHERGVTDWLLIDQNPYPGGLAASFRDDRGFMWDFAVHVAHSHYHYFDALMDTLLPDGFYHHQRKSWVRLYDAWVPYPFQYNFHRLPTAARDDCLNGLRNRGTIDHRQKTTNEAPSTTSGAQTNFREWILSSFGQGIADHFMIPYNRKIWTVDPSEMNSHWLGDRVPTVDLEKVERNTRDGIDEVGWGPNATFQFPKKDGTGAIWTEMFNRLPDNNKRLSTALISLDVAKREATLGDGSIVRYEHLVSTMPLKELAKLLPDKAINQKIARLKHSHVQVAGVGVFQPIPDELADKTWVYCPEEKARFYRVTPFSTFSPDHTPDPEKCCSFLCEFASPGDGPFISGDIGKMAVEGLRALGFMDINPKDLHIYTMQSEYGYPVPTVDRDDVLHDVLPALEKIGIYSRGRFGGWKYEAANMDHSVMQGVEAVNHALEGEDQPTIYRPNEVNAGKR